MSIPKVDAWIDGGDCRTRWVDYGAPDALRLDSVRQDISSPLIFDLEILLFYPLAVTL